MLNREVACVVKVNPLRIVGRGGSSFCSFLSGKNCDEELLKFFLEELLEGEKRIFYIFFYSIRNI